MSTMADTDFTSLVADLRAARFGACSLREVEAAGRALGWTMNGCGDVGIAGTPSGGYVVWDEDPYGKGGQGVRLTVDVGAIEPERFRHYLDLAGASWGEPTWLCGKDGLSAGWFDDDILRQLELDHHGNLVVEICSTDFDSNNKWYLWKHQHSVLELMDGEEEPELVDMDDEMSTAADEYEIAYTWSGHRGVSDAPGAEVWSIYTARHLRGMVTDLVCDVLLATRALGPGPDSLYLEFATGTQRSDRLAWIELTATGIRVGAQLTDHTRDYLIQHGFTDSGDGTAVRSWPAEHDQVHRAVTAAVVFLNYLGVVDGDLRMGTAGCPVPVDNFEVNYILDLKRDDDDFDFDDDEGDDEDDDDEDEDDE